MWIWIVCQPAARKTFEATVKRQRSVGFRTGTPSISTFAASSIAEKKEYSPVSGACQRPQCVQTPICAFATTSTSNIRCVVSSRPTGKPVVMSRG